MIGPEPMIMIFLMSVRFGMVLSVFCFRTGVGRAGLQPRRHAVREQFTLRHDFSFPKNTITVIPPAAFRPEGSAFFVGTPEAIPPPNLSTWDPELRSTSPEVL